MANNYYFIRNGKQEGPVPFDVLRAMARAERLKPTDKVQEEGKSAWIAAGSVPGLHSVPVAPKRTLIPAPSIAPGPSAQQASIANDKLPGLGRAIRLKLVVGGGIALILIGATLALVNRSRKQSEQVVGALRHSDPDSVKETAKVRPELDARFVAEQALKEAEANAEREKEAERLLKHKAREGELAKQRETEKKQELLDSSLAVIALKTISQGDKFGTTPFGMMFDMRRTAKESDAGKISPDLLSLEPTHVKNVPATPDGKKGLVHRYGDKVVFIFIEKLDGQYGLVDCTIAGKNYDATYLTRVAISDPNEPSLNGDATTGPDALLAKVKPGMTVAEVNSLIGNYKLNNAIRASDNGTGFIIYGKIGESWRVSVEFLNGKVSRKFRAN